MSNERPTLRADLVRKHEQEGYGKGYLKAKEDLGRSLSADYKLHLDSILSHLGQLEHVAFASKYTGHPHGTRDEIEIRCDAIRVQISIMKGLL